MEAVRKGPHPKDMYELTIRVPKSWAQEVVRLIIYLSGSFLLPKVLYFLFG